jgi:hypothetical protein
MHVLDVHIVINIFLIVNFIDHIVPLALSGKSIVRNMQLLYYPRHKMKDQPSTKLIQMNACIIKPRILADCPLPNPEPPTANPPSLSFLPKAISLGE